MLLTGSDADSIASIQNQLEKVFGMTDLGMLHYYLGIEVTQLKDFVVLSQSKYVKNM